MLNPICHLLALLEAYHILQVSRVKLKIHFTYNFLNVTFTFLHQNSSRISLLQSRAKCPAHFNRLCFLQNLATFKLVGKNNLL